MNILLDALGFFGARSKVQPKIGKIENYLVEIQDVSAGRKVNYRHFITAFGSKAREEGFRVVCLFGKYDADRLIEEFKNHMNQDFNVQNVLTLLTSINKEMNTTLRSKDYDRLALLTNTFKTILDVLGINLFVEKMNDEALDIYKKWNAARINKDFEAADKYRNMLVEWKVL